MYLLAVNNSTESTVGKTGRKVRGTAFGGGGVRVLDFNGKRVSSGHDADAGHELAVGEVLRERGVRRTLI